MVRFIIVRHGFSAGNKEKRYSGQRDVPLDEVGIKQAEAAAEYICKNFEVDSIYSSDLCRAYDTALPIAKKTGLTVTKLKDLREIYMGYWQGLSREEVAERFPETFEISRKTPGIIRFDGGESYKEAQERAISAFERIAEENQGKTVVVATHGGIIRAVRTAWEGVPIDRLHEIPDTSNASITVAEYTDGKVIFIKKGYNGHLEDTTSEDDVK